MGCIGSDEQRYNRYKEIAELVKELRIIGKEHEREQTASSPKTPTFPRFDHANIDGSTSKKDRKEAKKLAKAADRVPCITAKDIERIGEILHPEEPTDEDFERTLLMDGSIVNNVYYHPQTSNSREERHRFITQERRRKSELELSDAEMHDILVKLRVPNLTHAKSKSERVLVAKLREKIAEDFVHDHHEAQDTMMRKAGFWRWANRRTYNRLAANGRIWDHKDGAALAPVIEQQEDGEEEQAAAGAEDVAIDDEEVAVAVDGEHTDKVDEASDDLLSVASEASRFRPGYSSSASRDTSISSASRTTFSSNDESADDAWTTVGKAKPMKPTFTLKLTTNGGLGHLRPKTTPRTHMTFAAAAAFSMMSIADDENEHRSDDEAVSPRTPCPKRR